MKNRTFLRDIYHEYVQVECAPMDEEEAEIMKSIVTVEEELRRDMTEAERHLLEIYNDHMADLHALELGKAFEKGAIFSSQYWKAVF